MKMNKTVGRVATTLVATAMLASLAAVPAFAETFNDQGVIDTADSAKLASITFTDELMKPAMVTTPNVRLKFTLQNSTDVVTGATYTSDNKAVNLYNGVGAETALEAYAEFTADKGVGSVEGDESVNTVSTTVTFNIGNLTGFDDAGVYKYDINQEDVSTPYYNGSDLDLYLFVERITVPGADDSFTTEYRVTGAVLTKDGQVTQKTASTTHGYLVDPDYPDNPVTNDLVITKTVDGTMGNYGEDFNFTVTLPGDSDDKYNADYTKDGKTDTKTLTGGQNLNIKLGNGDKLRIYGLVEGQEYTVKEDSYTNKGYTTKINGTTTNEVTANYDADLNQVSVVNTRDAVSPTGIVMNVAPYALLVVIAAAGCFVFLRKRRED